MTPKWSKIDNEAFVDAPKMLTNEELGNLWRSMAKFIESGEIETHEDRLVSFLYEKQISMIGDSMRRYQEISEQNRANINSRWGHKEERAAASPAAKTVNARKAESVEEVQEFIDTLVKQGNVISFPAERFFNHYEGNGWTDKGGKPIRDWKATLIKQWVNGDPHPAKRTGSEKVTAQDYSQRDYTEADLEKMIDPDSFIKSLKK